MQITPLFSDELPNGDILLLGMMDDPKPYLIQIKSINYWYLIAKLPNMSEEQFMNFCKKIFYKYDFSYKYVYLEDGETFSFNFKFPYLQVNGNRKQIGDSLKQTEEYKYQKDMYFQQDLVPQFDKTSITLFQDYYIKELLKINKTQLSLEYQLLYDQLWNPYRYTKYDIVGVQHKYNLNFQQTLLLNEYEQTEEPQYHRIKIDINNIKQNPENLFSQHLQFYKYVVYDIENVVYDGKKTYNLWNENKKLQEDLTSYINQLSLPKNKKDRQTDIQFYDGYLTLTSKDDEIVKQQIILQEQQLADECSDQNELVCVSFIVSDFNDKILKRIALVRSQMKTNPEYADVVITCDSEKQLLQELIKLFRDKQYNLICQFNGWHFDDRVVACRCVCHNLLREFLQAFDFDNRVVSKYFKFVTEQKKIKKSGDRVLLIQNPLRFTFDIQIMNESLDTAIEKMENKTLQSMLQYYNLGSKDDISYQQITDWFLEYVELSGQKQYK